MGKLFFISDLKESVRAFAFNPILFVPMILLFIVTYALSNLSYTINHSLTENYKIIIFTIIYSLALLSVISFFLVTLISLAAQSLSGKPIFRKALAQAGKHWFRGLISILIIMIVFVFIWSVANYGVLYLGQFLNLGTKSAELLFFLVYFGGIIGILTFFTLSNFYIVLKELPLRQSISASFGKVKRNYPFVLSVYVVFYVINEITLLAGQTISEMIGLFIITPLLAILFSRLVVTNDIRSI